MSEDEPLARWAGRVAIEPGRLVYAGMLASTRPHRHHAIEVFSLDAGAVKLTDRDGCQLAAAAAVIPADTWHANDATHAAAGLVILLDPDTVTGRALGAGGDEVAGWVHAAAALQPAPNAGLSSPPEQRAEQVLGLLTGGAVPPTAGRHAAVAEALRAIARRLPGRVRVSEVADEVGLSPGRLGRLFIAQVGLPVPAYVRWLRLQHAMQALRAGANLTDAAHTAGFADSAHANRVCHEMFGLAPSEIAGEVDWA